MFMRSVSIWETYTLRPGSLDSVCLCRQRDLVCKSSSLPRTTHNHSTPTFTSDITNTQQVRTLAGISCVHCVCRAALGLVNDEARSTRNDWTDKVGVGGQEKIWDQSYTGTLLIHVFLLFWLLQIFVSLPRLQARYFFHSRYCYSRGCHKEFDMVF